MKTISITNLIKTYKTVFDHIPKDGFIVMRNNKAIAHVFRPDKKALKEKAVEVAEETIHDWREVQVDTFTTKRVEQLDTTLGICDRCHTQGEVKRQGFLNEFGVTQGKWLCVDGCYAENRSTLKRKALEGTDKKELTSSTGDFGGANEKRSF